MSIPTSVILRELENLPTYHTMKVSVNHSMRAGALVGAATALSGIIAGPIGLAAGGIISSIIAGVCNSGKFKSVSYIILYEMTTQEKEQLANMIRNTLNSNNIQTAYAYAKALSENGKFQIIIVQILYTFFAAHGEPVMT